MLKHPPQKEGINKQNKIVWINSPINPKHKRARKVLLLVKQVRNNLFHGGKVAFTNGFNHHKGLSRDRDIKLLEASLTILKTCFDFSAVQHTYVNASYV